MPMPRKLERSVKKLEDWKKEGLALFGTSIAAWRFKCVQCGEVQTAQEFVDLGGMTPDEAKDHVFFSCIGRVVKGRGCDWSLGGLFKVHTCEILTPDGKLTPVFEFADPLPKEVAGANKPA